MNKLTPKQHRFVEEYQIDLNATQAAIRAGYSAKTAYQIGHATLKKVEVQSAIQEALGRRSERTGITADKVLDGFARIAFAELNDETVQFADGTVRVKTADQLRALESLGRHLALFNDKISHEHSGDVVTAIEYVIVDPAAELPELNSEETRNPQHSSARTPPPPRKPQDRF